MSRKNREARNPSDLLTEPPATEPETITKPEAPADRSAPDHAPVVVDPKPEPAAAPVAAAPLPPLKFNGAKMPPALIVDGKPGFRSPRSQAAFAPHYPAVPGSLVDWSIKNGWPQWLCAAMLAGRPIGEIHTEAEAESIARSIAGLKLGR